MNRYKPHVLVVPEDDANRQLANGFLQNPALNLRAIQVLPPAGGWVKVLNNLLNDYRAMLGEFPECHLVLLIDFDGHVEARLARFKDSLSAKVRDLLRKAPPLQDINMLTSLLLATADEYAQDSYSRVASCGSQVELMEVIEEWLYEHTNLRASSGGIGYLVKRVPTNAIVWDAIVRAAKTGPSFPAADPREVIDVLTLALPDNQALSNLKVVAKHNPSLIFAQNILADTSSLTRVGYRVRFYEGVIPYTYPVSDVLHIFPRHRGFGYEEYIALVDAHRQKQVMS